MLAFLLTLTGGVGDDNTVRRSKNASIVGVSGIVVQETENTFKVVTRKDKLKGARLSLLFNESFRIQYASFFSFHSAAKARVRLCICGPSV